jgi:transcriptional regulator with XRE-family HTH domain
MHHDSPLKPLLSAIGAKLRKLRMASGDKERTIANSIGVSESVIGKIEHGEYPGLKLYLILRLASYFSVPISYFFTD